MRYSKFESFSTSLYDPMHYNISVFLFNLLLLILNKGVCRYCQFYGLGGGGGAYNIIIYSTL